MANDETRLALIEAEFNRLAKEIGIVQARQDKTDEWIHEHEKEEIRRHNEVMNAIGKVSTSIEESEKKSTGRLSTFDRILVSTTTLIGLVVFINWLYNLIKGTPAGP